MSTQAVEIQVFGRHLKVNCPTGQEDALRAAAADFDQRLKDMSERTKVSNVEQLLIFTGLNICNELHSERLEHSGNAGDLSNKINALEEKLDKALQNYPKR
ncbi:cell division protein ZapA [Photobacterium leiognathi]|uniref:Cell division protein ZapA n=1 Tax=Photobacterium leiognathi TaxID=553611 RepID=A0A2T3MD79_PHOLE|nr:cell division protein ZapA [Photobacterium leiognathi]KJF98544.1 Z-ring-associated protein [Photobacterium leiognathi]PSV91411.1 cell division protein ZapA [Photobacterium leiognathi]